MANTLPRILLALSSLILLVGGLMHAAAYNKTLSVVAASNLPSFYASSLKALWLIDSATLITLAAVFGFVAVRPLLASRSVLILLTIVPAVTAFFLYKFIGNFLPAHLLLASAIAAICGAMGLQSPANPDSP